MAYTGEIRMFAGSYAPRGWLPCDGSVISVADYPELVSAATMFGGNGKSFTLPDMRGRVPIHVSPAFALGTKGGSETVRLIANEMPAHTHPLFASDGPAVRRSAAQGDRLAESQGRIYGSPLRNPGQMSQLALSGATDAVLPHDNIQPSLSVTFIICASGLSPSQKDNDFEGEAMLGEIRIFTGNFAPKGWLKCEGQSLPISQNTAVFSIVATMYGGNGTSNFSLPDLRGVAPMAAGRGPGLSQRLVGQTIGSQTVTLNAGHVAGHTHPVAASQAPATSNDPAGNVLAVPFSGDKLYIQSSDRDLVPMATLGTAGGGQPHNNMQPYLSLTFMFATLGVYPSRP